MIRPRLWLVFFGDPHAWAWWAWAFRPGWRHVCAASYYCEAERWVFVDPVGTHLVIGVHTSEEFDPIFATLVVRSSRILRFVSQGERGQMPAMFYCVAAIKALLGVRCAALTPYGLMRALMARGAEIVARSPE